MSSKKVPFHRHREAEEARKKREEDEAARVYAEFVESFKGDSNPGSKAFVRGGFIDPNKKHENDSEGGKSKEGVTVPKKGSRYVPSFLPPSMGKELEKKREEERPKEREKGKTRAIDKFLEELKYEQEQRERRNQEREARNRESSAAPSSHFDEPPDESDPTGRFGSLDDGDPQTTNLYVGNLSPKVDENFLLRTFGRFGPIASVKIMWPRTEEERRRQRNCGFVAFMNRADGQAAKDEMQGVIVYDYELKIGWGKSVALPSQALPAPPPGHMAIRSKEGANIILSGAGGPPIAPVTAQNSELVLTPNVPDITVEPPEDERLRRVIDTMALHVLDGGCAFEQAVMERGRGNPLFSFLFDLRSKEHTYYVWRLYSFAQGDILQRWRTEPFIMITGSGRWIPPSLPSTRSPEHVKESSTTFAASKSRRVELERTLTDWQRDEFEDMLRALTLERSQIKDAMGFSLDNADAAGEIVDVLTESLTLKETSIPTKVARLMLVSDILHNSSAPVKNASAFRTKFEATLPDIMESFNDLYRSITGRITAEALKERVLKVLQVWSDWFLFSDAFLNGLRATFLRSGNSGVVPFHSLCGDAPEIDNKVGSGESTGDMSASKATSQDGALAVGRAAARSELLGLPLAELERRCRHNGLSLAGGREMMVARLLSLEEADRENNNNNNNKINIININNNDNDIRYEQVWHSSQEYRRDMKEEVRYGEEINSTVLGHGTVLSFPHESESDGEGEGEGFVGKKGKGDPVLPDSKWARDDDDDVSDEVAGDGVRADELDVVKESSVQAQPESSLNEEQRQKLRRLEVAVMEYRETLEERGVRNSEEIEKKVSAYRTRMEAEFGLSDSSVDGRSNRHSSEKGSTRDKERSRSHDDTRDDSSRKRRRSRSRSRSPSRRRSSERERDHHRRDRSSRERDDRHDRDRRRR